MAKKCIVNRSPDDQIRFVGTPNPNQTDAVKLAISRNKGNPLSQTSKGEPSLLYNSYIELLGLSPEAAEKAVAEQFSDKFGRWFGRWWEPGNTNVSKVVDENGQPRIVWSGQKGQYFTGEYKGYSDTFEKDGMMRFDRTALFTYSKYDALSYATGWDMPDAKTFERVGKYITEPYHLEPVFLNIRNMQSVEKLNYDKVIPRFPEFESKKIDGLTGLSDAANGAVRELIAIRDSHQMRLVRPEINFQNETSNSSENIPQEVLQEITDVLLQKGLVSQVNLMTTQELRQVLEEMGLSEETMKQIEAWHGSPHLFDKFSTSAIGTGEGAQAFGWGLYFTDLKSIAENYAEKLSDVTFEGKHYGSDNVGLANATILLIRDAGNVEKAIDDLNKLIEEKGGSERSLSLLEFLSTNKDKYNVKKNLYNVSLHQGKTPSEYTWLEWDRPVSESILNKIFPELSKSIKKIGIYNGKYNTDAELKDLITNERATGDNIYTVLKDGLGSDKAASLFLLENGIDGVKYPAESISRGATSDTARGFNYVVFDENAVTIQEVVQFQNELDNVGLKLVPNGFYRPSTRQIYLNSENPRILETTIHEFAHPFLQYLRDNKPAHYRAGVKLLETNSNEAQEYIDLVLRTQPGLKQGSEKYYEEVLAEIISSNGIKLITSNKNNSILQWLKDFWENIGKILGITRYTPEEISKMTLREFSEAVTSEMLNNVEITPIDNLIRTGLELGYEYDTDKVARERFDISKLHRIGSGSDRVVYDLNDSYVLKVAKTARGLEQNYHEGDLYLVDEEIIPRVIEKGLNYVVVEKVVPIKAKDLVPIYDTEGEQIGTERADQMFAELSRFHQADFDRHEQKLLNTLYKYGLYEVVNFEILMGDFARKANWGIRDGRPIHLDGGTFAGESLLTDYAGKKNLEDPDFREIYQRSREAKKLYGDRDTNTMFQIEDRREKDLIKEKAIENGTWMKAPNGKPTNLNEYQYLEVRTERFKNWFGDWQNNPENASKVVDENGEPRVMYTGTSKDKDFKKFNVPRNGVWFTSDPNEASMYAMDNDSKTAKIDSSGNYKDVNTASRVIPVFLNLRTIADFNREVTPEQREKLKYANNYKKIQGDLFQNIYFSRSLDENRFDGIDYTGDGKVMVVLMNPNTIKSAIGNTGAYSLDNNDIRFQMSEVTQNQMIPSQLYEQLRQQPFVDSEQALEAYKNVYTDSVGDWQSTEFNC